MKTAHQKISQKMKRRQERLKNRQTRVGRSITLLEWQKRQRVLVDQREAMEAYAKVVMDMDSYAKGQEATCLPDQVGEAQPSGGL